MNRVLFLDCGSVFTDFLNAFLTFNFHIDISSHVHNKQIKIKKRHQNVIDSEQQLEKVSAMCVEGLICCRIIHANIPLTYWLYRRGMLELMVCIHTSKIRFEPVHDKTNKITCAKRRLRSDSESSLPSWRSLGSLSTHWEHSEDSDLTGWMTRLIWVFTGRTGHFVGFFVRMLI